ncbi:MAG: hypothetical protein LVT47_03685 [Cyanobacteria bacterium LVE1205-1]
MNPSYFFKASRNSLLTKSLTQPLLWRIALAQHPKMDWDFTDEKQGRLH